MVKVAGGMGPATMLRPATASRADAGAGVGDGVETGTMPRSATASRPATVPRQVLSPTGDGTGPGTVWRPTLTPLPIAAGDTPTTAGVAAVPHTCFCSGCNGNGCSTSYCFRGSSVSCCCSRGDKGNILLPLWERRNLLMLWLRDRPRVAPSGDGSPCCGGSSSSSRFPSGQQLPVWWRLPDRRRLPRAAGGLPCAAAAP